MKQHHILLSSETWTGKFGLATLSC